MVASYFKSRRYRIYAKRKHTRAEWSEWTMVDTYKLDLYYFKQIEELGFFARIIDSKKKHNKMSKGAA